MDIQEKYPEFIDYINIYYKSIRVKLILLLDMSYLIEDVLLDEFRISTLITIILINIILYLSPSLLRNETLESISKFTLLVKEDNTYICNIRLFNGPTFGIIKIHNGYLEFKSFKFHDDGFKINLRCNDTTISYIQIKRSIIDILFFKPLTKGILINDGCNVKKILQTSDNKKVLEKVAREIKLL